MRTPRPVELHVLVGLFVLSSIVGTGRAASAPSAPTPSSYVAIALPTLGGNNATAIDIAPGERIVGWAETASGDEHAVRWENGKVTDLGTASGAESLAMAVNASGLIVGYTAIDGDHHAIAWKNDGTSVDLGALGGAQSEATGVNTAGDIVGWTTDEAAAQVAVVWNPADAAIPAASPTASAPPATAELTLSVNLRDIRFDPAELTIPEETLITLIVTNKGAATHTFNIDELDVHSGVLNSGESVTIKFDSGSPGVYTYYCSVPGHREAGMVGKLIVTKSGNIAVRSGSPQASPTAQPTVLPRATVRPIPRHTATAAADGCAGFDAYKREMEALQLKMLFEPGAITLMTLGEGDDLFSLTPEQYENIADVFGIVADGMVEIDPPSYARAWHEDVRAEFDLLRSFFNAMATGSIPVSIFRDVSNGDKLDAQIAADAAAAAKVCPAFATFAEDWSLGGGI